jgi:phage terminase large subunit-like protein
MRRSLRPNQYLRMIENRFVTSESSFVDMSNWDKCTHPDARPVISDKSMHVWLGVDASVKHDSTAIVGVGYDRKLEQVRLLWHRVFQPTPDKPLQFEATIEATLKELSHRFQFRRCLFDPFQMMAVSQRLAAARLPIEEFPQTTGNLTAMSQNLFELVEGNNLVLYPDSAMRLAASRAVAVETPRGWRISKEKQSHKIDVIIALAMACHAAVQDSSLPYYDRSFSAFQPDADDNKTDQSSYAVGELRSAIVNGLGWGPPSGRRWS